MVVRTTDLLLADSGLRLREQRFVDAFIRSLVARDAAVEAGWSKNTAGAAARRLLHKDEVREAILHRISSLTQAADADARRVIEALVKLAFYEITDAAIWDNDVVVLRSSSDLPADLRFAVKSVETKYDKNGDPCGVKIAFHDKLRALELLGRYHDLWAPSRLEVSGPGGGPVQVEGVRPRFDQYPIEIQKGIWELVEQGEAAVDEAKRIGDGVEVREVVDV